MASCSRIPRATSSSRSRAPTGTTRLPWTRRASACSSASARSHSASSTSADRSLRIRPCSPGPASTRRTTCADVPNYSVQLRFAGVCNAQDTLAASGTLLTRGYGDRAATRRPKGVRLASLQLTRPTAGSSGSVLATLGALGPHSLPGGSARRLDPAHRPGWGGRSTRLPKRDDDRDRPPRQPQGDSARAAGRLRTSGDGTRLRDPRRLPDRLARSAVVSSRALLP